LTREQAANEPFVWLETLMKAATQNQAVDAMRMVNAVTAAVAPGQLKDGGTVRKQIMQHFKREAGI
jgi:hypothetical protein